MSSPLVRTNGLHQWDAKVAATDPGHAREIVRLTVFSDTRDDAVRDACQTVESMGLINPTVDHITRVGK